MRQLGLPNETCAFDLSVNGFNSTGNYFQNQSARGLVNLLTFASPNTPGAPVTNTRGGHPAVDFTTAWYGRMIISPAAWTWIIVFRTNLTGSGDLCDLMQSLFTNFQANDMPAITEAASVGIYSQVLAWGNWTSGNGLNVYGPVSGNYFAVGYSGSIGSVQVLVISNDAMGNRKAQINNGPIITVPITSPIYAMDAASWWRVGYVANAYANGSQYMAGHALYGYAQDMFSVAPNTLATAVTNLMADFA